ncbi:stage II sporulation protein M [Cellulomonas sp. NPDC089187]|uniref:stage II sporulation protein M n=1 Tax=Cellulomonas sp. NPDC089187 TaxID=3154970 RepID=UPI00343C417A
MDIDAFLAVRRPTWERLDQLARRSRLTGAQADELIRLYQSAATDLSTVRSAAPDPDTVTRLSQSLARARATIAGRHEPAWRDVTGFLAVSLPAALYRIRWWSITVTLVFLALATLSGWWVATQPGVLDAMMTPEQQQEYVETAFAEYYDPGAGFAGVVWTNNAWIAAVCIGIGITGIGPAYILLTNAVSVGSMGGLMAAHGSLDTFFTLIAPHGLLELTSIFVAGAAGLRLFWAWISPGGRPRSRALAEEGRALITVAIGLVLTLFISGLIEGFVTGSSLLWWVKIAIGALALAAFWAYTLVLGGRAARAGHTGDLSEDEAGYTVAVAG